MATITQHAPGTFCWPELGTTDQNAAKKFYSALLGWTANDTDMGGGEIYTIFQKDGKDVAALYTLRKEQRDQGVPPNWGSYVSAESADAAVAKAKSLGATVLMEPFDVMEHGRMAVLQDPTGAVVSIWQAKDHVGAVVMEETGALCWTELMTTDTAKAGSFYSQLFGWKTAAFPTQAPTPTGDYTLFKRGETNAGGMMKITPEMGPMPSHWMPYFGVDDCDKSVARAKELGAKVMVPPTDIPDTGRFAVLQDPQGAHVAIIRPKTT